MPRTPAWWRPDATHWSGRTTATIALLSFIAATSLALVALNRPPESPDASTGEQSRPEMAPAPGAPATACSMDSEGSVSDGWGPDRAMYHDDTFPTSLTFNSTSDNPNYGDERNFVVAKPHGNAKPGGWLDSIEVHNNEQYVIRIYARLDGPESHVAKGAKLMVSLPTCTAHRLAVSAIINSTDAFPGELWDGVSFWSRNDFNLALVPDSGRLYNNSHPNPGLPFSVNDLVTTKGVPFGSKELDGIFESGYKHSAVVTFRVRAQVAE